MQRFQRLFGRQQKTFMPFFMLGDPTPSASLNFIKTAIDAGADALELGMPFSDSIADGPVMLASAARALRAGCDFQTCMGLLTAVRQYTDIPVGVMLYYNLLYRQGLTTAYHALQQADVDAILHVDVPIEQATYQEPLAQANIGSVNFFAPNTPDERINAISQQTTAFAYVISTVGTTGVRDTIATEVMQRIQHLRKITTTPMMVGFGIHNGKQIRALCEAGAQGAIIGSAITNIIATHLDDTQQAAQAIQAYIKHVVAEMNY